jgi:hypothetical protein
MHIVTCLPLFKMGNVLRDKKTFICNQRNRYYLEIADSSISTKFSEKNYNVELETLKKDVVSRLNHPRFAK